MKKFKNKFQIPQCYGTPAYQHLWTNIVMWDYSSDFGVHANLETLVGRITFGGDPPQVTVQYQSGGDVNEVNTMLAVLTGYRILKSFDTILRDCSGHSQAWPEVKCYIHHAIQRMRRDYADRTYGGAVPVQVLVDIAAENESKMHERFHELLGSAT